MKRRLGAGLLALLWMMTGAWAAAQGTEGAETAVPAAETEAAPEETPEEIEYARNISEYCLLNGRPGGPGHALTDGTYAKAYETGVRWGVHSLEIEVVEGEPMGALYIQWEGDPVPVAVQVPNGENWVTVAETEGIFFADYIPFPDCTKCRLVGRDSLATQLKISDMKVLTAGTPEPDIQVWRKAEGKVDMILLTGHPDDELLWFGGALPYYAGEKKKDVLVICCAMTAQLRRLELCDALWACGVRIHPIYLHRLDFSERDMRVVLQKWHAEDEVKDWITGYFRQFKPDVLLLHDVDGEYGHAIHKAASWLGTECARLAADEKEWPVTARRYGVWEIPKVYVHLYKDNQIHMDWNQPLEAFGGKTALEAAMDAMEFHRSQTVHGWAIQEGGDYDNALFGLVSSTVGPDVEKNDFFENIN